MATSFEKVYSVTVTFTSDIGDTITDADLHSVQLREGIKAAIEQYSRRSVGMLSAQPGEVSESDPE